MTVRYDPAERCADGPTRGAIALRDHWRRTTGLADIGIYNCRTVRGGKSRSVHSEGRAIDLKANAFDATEHAVADNYTRWLIEHAEELQVQYIIWNGLSWKSGRGWKPYDGVSEHKDHVHVELNHDGARAGHALLGGNALPTPPTRPPEATLAELAAEVAAAVKMVLKVGSQGDPVKIAQTALNGRGGAALKVDGDFGKKTDTAVRQIQDNHRRFFADDTIDVDGVIGPRTWFFLLAI
jgi:hypothetical protein